MASTVETQKRGFFRYDLLFTGDQCHGLRARPDPRPVHKPRGRAGAGAGRSSPDGWASMRSIARWVLPVFVGPSTAVTVRDRALDGGSGRFWRRGMKAACDRLSS